MKKKLVRLTESDLHRIVENSVKRIIKEKKEKEYVQGNLFGDDSEYSEPKGALEKREAKQRKKKEDNKKRAEAAKESKYKKENDAKNEFTRSHSMFKEGTDLHKIVENCVESVIKEIGDTPRGQEALGAVAGRAYSRYNNRRDIYGTLDNRAKLSNIENNANDESWENKGKMKYRGDSWKKGWKYGYNKGAEGTDSIKF